MLEKIRRIKPARLLPALAVITAFGILGSYLLITSQAQSPRTAGDANREQSDTAANLLRPISLGYAPYQYIAYSSSMEQSRVATGIDQYFAAFVISDGTCTPTWGGTTATGLNSPRSSAILADISQVQAAGGEITVSFGGSHGMELATACTEVDDLTAAYRSVIDAYDVNRIDLDIEGPALADLQGMARRSQAIAKLQQDVPDLQIWLTLPAHVSGLTQPALEVIRQMQKQQVKVTGINIMAMNYNIGSKNMGTQALSTTDKVFDQLRGLYPDNTDAQIWQAIGITVMVGRNDTAPETFTLEDARQVRAFADGKGIGMLSIWNTNRDVPCPAGGSPSKPSVSCSSVSQQPYEFTKILSAPATQ